MQQQLSVLQKTAIEDMWLKELKELEKEYIKWLKVMSTRVPKKSKKGKGRATDTLTRK